jgi:UDP-glucuronate decarboxylase
MNHPITTEHEDMSTLVSSLGESATELAGKHLVLTGATGFLGTQITNILMYLNENVLQTPCRLTLIDNFISSEPFIDRVKNDSLSFLTHNVSLPIPHIEEKIDFVMHAAGIASPSIYMKHPLEALNVSISGTQNILELAKFHGAKVLFFSSSEIYGDPDSRNVPTSEQFRGNVSTMGPRACYDEGKRVGETLCYIYHSYFDVHTNVVRPFNVFGPGMRETDRRVLSNFARQIKNGVPLTVYGTGLQTRTYCYIYDAVAGFLLALLRGRGGEAYNIGNPNPEINIKGLVSVIESVLGRPVELSIIPHPPDYPTDEPMRRCPDISKARADLGYEPVFDLKTGITRFLGWTDQNYHGLP